VFVCDLGVSVPQEMSREELIGLVAQRDAQITTRDGQITMLSTQVADLLEANERLAAKLARLEHLLTRNSGNSSMPPSKDDDPGKTPPEKPARQAGGPKRKRGKQPGAPGANLAWVESPTRQVDRFPQGHCECGHDLAQAIDLGIVDRYQQHEIPQMSAHSGCQLIR
jgi:transposase